VAHFREISSDRWSRVSLIRKASSSAAENVMAIVLAYFQSVCQDRRQSTYDVKRLWVFQPGSGSVGAIAIVSESPVGAQAIVQYVTVILYWRVARRKVTIGELAPSAIGVLGRGCTEMMP
jgi:hypothetical protein